MSRAIRFLTPVALATTLVLVVPCARAAGQEAEPPRAERVSLDLKSADLLDVLRYFSEVSGLNLVVYPGVGGTVTVRLIDVPWDQALAVILRAQGLAMEVGANVLEVAPAEVLLSRAREEVALAQANDDTAPLVTRLIRVSYGDAAAIAAIVEKVALSPRGSVVVDARTSTLIVTDLESRFGRVRGVVQSLDR